MKRLFAAIVLVFVLVLMNGLFDAAECGHRIGGGIHYLKTLGEIKDAPEWDSNAVGFIASYQYNAGLLKFEGDLEWVLDYGGSDNTLFQPQAWLIIGGVIYGGAGIGGSYIDGDWLDNPFYGIRLGVDISIGGIGLDLFTSYQWQSSTVFDEIDQTDLDSITFGAIVRFGK